MGVESGRFPPTIVIPDLIRNPLHRRRHRPRIESGVTMAYMLPSGRFPAPPACVIPAKAGTQSVRRLPPHWLPAFAGMTKSENAEGPQPVGSGRSPYPFVSSEVETPIGLTPCRGASRLRPKVEVYPERLPRQSKGSMLTGLGSAVFGRFQPFVIPDLIRDPQPRRSHGPRITSGVTMRDRSATARCRTIDFSSRANARRQIFVM